MKKLSGFVVRSDDAVVVFVVVILLRRVRGLCAGSVGRNATRGRSSICIQSETRQKRITIARETIFKTERRTLFPKQKCKVKRKFS